MNIIGHQKIIDYFERALKHDSLAHAYLFSGPEHVGKMTVAKWLVEKLLSSSHPEFISGSNLDSEQTLKQVQGDSNIFWSRLNPDIKILQREEGKKEIAIEQVKSLREFIHQKPFVESHKIIIIEKIEQMSIPAVNALLKTLEEPPGKSLLILTSDYLSRVPETIISRCQLIKFNKVSQREIKNSLQDIKDKKLDEKIYLADGRPGSVLDWLENDQEFDELNITNEKLIDLLTGDVSLKFSYVEQLFSKKLALVEQGQIAIKLLKNYEVIFRDIILLELGLSDKIINTNNQTKLQKIASNSSLSQLSHNQRQLAKTREVIAQNVNPRLALENLMLNLN